MYDFSSAVIAGGARMKTEERTDFLLISDSNRTTATTWHVLTSSVACKSKYNAAEQVPDTMISAAIHKDIFVLCQLTSHFYTTPIMNTPFNVKETKVEKKATDHATKFWFRRWLGLNDVC